MIIFEKICFSISWNFLNVCWENWQKIMIEMVFPSLDSRTYAFITIHRKLLKRKQCRRVLIELTFRIYGTKLSFVKATKKYNYFLFVCNLFRKKSRKTKGNRRNFSYLYSDIMYGDKKKFKYWIKKTFSTSSHFSFNATSTRILNYFTKKIVILFRNCWVFTTIVNVAQSLFFWLVWKIAQTLKAVAISEGLRKMFHARLILPRIRKKSSVNVV